MNPGKLHRCILLHLGAALLVFRSMAQAITLTPEQAAERAVRNNPSLEAARFRIQEARGRVIAAGRLSNPEAEFEFAQNPRMPERRFAVAWMQKFPVTSRLRLEKAVSRAELAAAEAEVRDAERKTAGDVRATAVKLLAIERQRELRRQQIANSEELTAFMQRRLATGEGSAAEAIQMQVETGQLGTQIIQLDVEQTTMAGELRILLGLSPDAALSIAGNLSVMPSVPAPGAHLERRADYRAAQAMAEASAQSVALARANKWEDIGVGVMAEHERAMDEPMGYERDTMLGFKVNVPLPLWDQNDGQIAEARAAAGRSRQQLAAVAAQIRGETATTRSEMATIRRTVAKIDDVLAPQTKQVEEQLRSTYQAGQTPLSEVLRARAARFMVEAQRLDALRDYRLAYERYKTAAGTLRSGSGRSSK
jgi:outer membrane protein, heavy metal efflux system